MPRPGRPGRWALPLRWRGLALPLMLPLLAPPVARPAAGHFELVAVDIGQGTAVLVRTRHELLVYDTGPSWGPEGDAGSRHVLPLLRRRGETRIDRLVLSHRDIDHVGGAAALIDALPVRELASSLEDGHPLRARAAARGARVRPCVAGEAWRVDGVDFTFLHPPAELLRAAASSADTGATTGSPVRPPKPNALSCVLRVRDAGGATVLLTGDIEAAQEAALVAQAGWAAQPVQAGQDHEPAPGGPDLRADVLFVPHHGSRTSSTAAFIDAVAPRVAVVQAAYRSRFGHPAPDVVARYEARGIAVVRSDRCGAWTWAGPLGNPGPAGRCEREAARRYWHHRAHGPAPG